jgi:hypothetical protein
MQKIYLFTPSTDKLMPEKLSPNKFSSSKTHYVVLRNVTDKGSQLFINQERHGLHGWLVGWLDNKL